MERRKDQQKLLCFVHEGASGLFLQHRRSDRIQPKCATRMCVGAEVSVEFGGIQHAGMIVENTQKALKFYTKVLGMVDDTATRPNLAFKGAFVRAGAQQVHLMELPNPDPKQGRPDHGGRDKHVAFSVKNIDPLIKSLDENGVKYTMSKSGRRALFCRDIDCNALEFIEQTDL
eukprot:Plantae.Rhodophyta-Purpureofilum_apyrenoidigerum.ctg2758.p1 GENE.Plantae.Rhodophyta-Purpureofilum_apyrenoidigerum.ctg2758~~Plantae.Rhodophyta-Purpureofilum_apyrenoidigerum.ctg2758.p1  ORF type:complete len:173 (-),score=28.09 Plantae.Rhodophyta-Purpureofilum_apyrenoidigerum.ctg2758:189-707(-)